MIETLKPQRAAKLRPEINRLIEDFGRLQVFAAAVRAVLRPGTALPVTDALSDRLRRDIGLGPAPARADWRLLR